MRKLHPNPISMAVAPVVRLLGKPYYDLDGNIELARRLLQDGVVDGIEFQNIAEWDERTPPRDEGPHRLVAWKDSWKYRWDELASRLMAARLPVLSVHANRDVGICLCSQEKQDIDRGRVLVNESLALASQLGAGVCVFHLWDTWKPAFDPAFLVDNLQDIASQYPWVKAAVENVPTQLAGVTPFELVKNFEWITLDLRWSAVYGELGKFEALKTKIANVHLSGQLVDQRWSLLPTWFPNKQPSFGFYEAMETILGDWEYKGPLTVEVYDLPVEAPWGNLCAAMASLRQ